MAMMKDKDTELKRLLDGRQTVYENLVTVHPTFPLLFSLGASSSSVSQERKAEDGQPLNGTNGDMPASATDVETGLPASQKEYLKNVVVRYMCSGEEKVGRKDEPMVQLLTLGLATGSISIGSGLGHNLGLRGLRCSESEGEDCCLCFAIHLSPSLSFPILLSPSFSFSRLLSSSLPVSPFLPSAVSCCFL